MREYEFIKFDRDGQILVMTLNRAEKRNAINGRMHAELVDAFRELNQDEESRVVVLTGAGPSFCAGGDISGWVGPTGTNLSHPDYEVHSGGRRLVDAILWVEKPVICMLRGAAFGLGATIALLCDVVYASTDSVIADLHVQYAAAAGDGGAALWPLLIGMNRAKELLMTGRKLSGEEAAAIGLVNKAVSPEELKTVTFSLARELAALEPYAVRATKASINRHLRRAVEDILDLSIAWERIWLTSDAHRSAASSFMAKRDQSSKSEE